MAIHIHYKPSKKPSVRKVMDSMLIEDALSGEELKKAMDKAYEAFPAKFTHKGNDYLKGRRHELSTASQKPILWYNAKDQGVRPRAIMFFLNGEPHKVMDAKDASFPSSIVYKGDKYIATGKKGKNNKGEESAEYEMVDKEGRRAGKRIWKEQSGKVIED